MFPFPLSLPKTLIRIAVAIMQEPELTELVLQAYRRLITVCYNGGIPTHSLEIASEKISSSLDFEIFTLLSISVH